MTRKTRRSRGEHWRTLLKLYHVLTRSHVSFCTLSQTFCCHFQTVFLSGQPAGSELIRVRHVTAAIPRLQTCDSSLVSVDGKETFINVCTCPCSLYIFDFNRSILCKPSFINKDESIYITSLLLQALFFVWVRVCCARAARVCVCRGGNWAK